MPEVLQTGHVSAGAADVWDVVSRVQSMLDWYPTAGDVEKIDGPDEGVGRVQRVRYRAGVRNATVDSEVIEWLPERCIAWRQVREFLGSKQAPLLARNITTRVSIQPDSDGCDVQVAASWDPVGLKGELATETVIRPKAETLVGNVLERLIDECDADADGG